MVLELAKYFPVFLQPQNIMLIQMLVAITYATDELFELVDTGYREM